MGTAELDEDIVPEKFKSYFLGEGVDGLTTPPKNKNN